MAALGYFGRSLWEIERVLDAASPDHDLRDALASAIWKYARGLADQDGLRQGPVARVNAYIREINKKQQPLREALLLLFDAYASEDVAAIDTMFVFSNAGVDVPLILEQLERMPDVAEVNQGGGRPSDIEHHVLMARVAGIYEFATKKRQTVTTSPYTTPVTYSGKFVRIAELVEAAAAAATKQQPLPNSALGLRLKRMTAKRR